MSVNFVLSPGRCGTQWLSHFLNDMAKSDSDPLKHWITHEPLALDYSPSHNTPEEPLKFNRNIIINHKEKIRKHILDGGVYIECGFPCWRHIKWFKNSLSDICDLKIIYIHREPIANASSLVKISSFVPPILATVPVKNLYLPGENSRLPNYTNIWEALSPFAKNLVYWAEVHLQAENYQQQWKQENWLTVAFEELFSAESTVKIARFLNFTQEINNSACQRFDQFNIGLHYPVNPSEYYLHPDIIKVAHSLGYSCDSK